MNVVHPLTTPDRFACPGRCTRFKELQALKAAGLATWEEEKEWREMEREAVRREAQRKVAR